MDAKKGLIFYKIIKLKLHIINPVALSQTPTSKLGFKNLSS